MWHSIEGWAAGAVSAGSGSSNVGGLIGNNASPNGGITKAYWDSFSTGQAAGAGSNAGSLDVTAVTSDPAQSLAPNYAFNPTSYGAFTLSQGVFDFGQTRRTASGKRQLRNIWLPVSAARIRSS